MLTVKLQNRTTGRTKIVECVSAEIIPDGREVRVEAVTPGGREVFIVSPEADPAGLYTIAYVETAAGSTTQIVRAPWENASRHRIVHR